METKEFLEEVSKVFPEGKLELEKAKEFLDYVNQVDVILRLGADQYSDRSIILYEDGSMGHVSLLDHTVIRDAKHLNQTLDNLQFKQGYHLEKIRLSMVLETKNDAKSK